MSWRWEELVYAIHLHIQAGGDKIGHLTLVVDDVTVLHATVKDDPIHAAGLLHVVGVENCRPAPSERPFRQFTDQLRAARNNARRLPPNDRLWPPRSQT